MNDDISKVVDDGRASIMKIEEDARKKEKEREKNEAQREKRLERALEEVRKREEKGVVMGGEMDVVVASGATRNNVASSESSRSVSQVNIQSQGQSQESNFLLAESSKKGRGNSYLLPFWNSGDLDKRLKVSLNKLGSIIGEDHAKLSTAFGVLARMVHLLPLNYEMWSDMPISRHDDVWNDVQANTTLPLEARKVVLTNLNAILKDWEKILKALYYTPHKDDPEYLAMVPDIRWDQTDMGVLDDFDVYSRMYETEPYGNQVFDNRIPLNDDDANWVRDGVEGTLVDVNDSEHYGEDEGCDEVD
ncbi:hypothetical protein BUALT_Bualt04G0089000 [Buddleja alternifolia]|uniref:Uncharacterized protein n=1 Tax=Buddleja alternifolia TaxID=168488 RepID=A0AAV6XVH9_9LAMI|nr:hypothetical protein BUALT_Bualt04G0089000 [Buddleja alternifolia]